MDGSQRTQSSASYYGREVVLALKFGGGTIIRSILELHLGAHMLAIFLIIIGISLVVAVNVSILVPVAPAGPIMIVAGIVIIMLSWCSALIEASGRQAAETSLLRVRLFTSARNSDPMQSVEANAVLSNHRIAHMVLSDIELPCRFSFDGDELPIFITKPARGRGDSNQAGQKNIDAGQKTIVATASGDDHTEQSVQSNNPDDEVRGSNFTTKAKNAGDDNNNNNKNAKDDQMIGIRTDDEMALEEDQRHLIPPEKY